MNQIVATKIDVNEIAKKLSSQQRLALVAIEAGFVIYYGIACKGDVIPSYYAVRSTNTIQVSNMKQMSRICHALFTRGLLAPVAIVDGQSYSAAKLSDIGKMVFDIVATQDEKEDIAREARWAKKQEEDRVKSMREHAFDEENYARRRANSDRRRDADMEKSRLEKEILAIALKLGQGANNIDELLAENKRLVSALYEQVVIVEDCDAVWEQIQEERKALFT